MNKPSVSRGVSQDRLWRRHVEMARLGATAKGGVNRPALSPEDGKARRLLCDWARARSYPVFADGIGNLFIRRPGSDKDAAPVMSGSHIDSQPTGGRFDGIYGVLAAFEALEALDDAGIATKRPIEAVVWTNEEGSRFQPGTMGSAVYVGNKRLEDVLGVADAKGVLFKEALAQTLTATPEAAPRAFGAPVAGYVEAHIEQGPRLEIESKQIGIVTGIQGTRWFTVEITGEEAHAGTTPLGARADALVAAVDMVQALRQIMHDPEDVLRFTVGRFEVSPNSPNTVPGRVLFTIDFRHPDDQVLRGRGDRVAEICRKLAGRCQVKVTETTYTTPVWFDEQVVRLVERAAATLDYSRMRIFSGAGHDARCLAKLCPTGMIFVPCARGISHNEAEDAKPEDLAAGTRVLAEVLVDLANR